MILNEIDKIIASHYKECEYPVCIVQSREWGTSRPLEGLTVLDATPCFRNSLVKYRALIAAGANFVLGLADGYPHDKNIAQLLADNGIKIVHSTEQQSLNVDVILDCAASFSHWKARLGVVELTRSGVPKYAGTKQPVFVADGGAIKKIETCLGTGDGYYRAMRHLGYSDWQGKKLVIFGSGKVGSGLLVYAVRHGAQATVVTQPQSVTPKVRQLAAEIIDCANVDAVVTAVSQAYAVVTATGVAGALAHPALSQALINSSAILANMGVEDEYGPDMPAARVLNNKMVLNFMLDEPTHLKYIDATMALHNEGIIYLLSHPDAARLINPPVAVEERILDITRRNGCITAELNMI